MDSEEFHWQAWRETMATEGRPIARQQFLATFGLRNDVILRDWLGSGADADRIRRIGEGKEVRYRELVRRLGITALPGAAHWVKSLERQHWLQAVASSAPRLNVDVVLEQIRLAGRFQAIVAAEDVVKGKPDPEVFLTAASRLDVETSRCIVVEDAPAGIEAARRAGMRSIGVNRSGASMSADLVVSSLEAIPQDTFQLLALRS